MYFAWGIAVTSGDLVHVAVDVLGVVAVLVVLDLVVAGSTSTLLRVGGDCTKRLSATHRHDHANIIWANHPQKNTSIKKTRNPKYAATS